ncbi:MAG: WD40 repeat domain-containing protein [Sulfurimonas sp.]|uniref:WD40 repeat domain-containing protein n=1 Tax=Sulfurimonas sp. TaxID=2022749 RepID=UPI0025FF8BA6|nr:WD40 repeat domain-containing protein [Sulfurimonas sp.]MCK9492347.1 WD40 repeat domain-containing protein [Sulfurimonas sp.]
MKPSKEISFKNAIIRVKIMEDGKLLVVDAKSVVRFLDLVTLKTASGFKCGVEYKSFKRQVFDFSDNGLYFTLISATKKESLLYNAKNKKTIAKMDRHSGEVNCVAIDPNSKYMFSCGDDGKSYAIDIENKKIAFTLPIHSDSLTDIAFSKNAQWVATASYDKKIHLFNLITMTKKHRLIGHNEEVLKVHFLSENRLLSVDKANTAIVWDCEKGKVIERLEGIHDDISSITSSDDGIFLFLGSELGYVMVFELESYKMLSRKYIKLTSTITALEFHEKTSQLIVATEDADLLFYHIFASEERIAKFLRIKSYKKIQEIVEENPLLAYTKAYQLVISIWDSTVKKARLALEKNDKETALELFGNFQYVPARNTAIKAIIKEYKEFDKFAKFAQESKFPLAYALALQHPHYQDSQLYKALELNWKKTFCEAKKYAIDPKGADLAREILAPYRGVTQKTKLIQELFAKSEVYKRFRVAVGQKDYKVAFELIKLNPFLKELPDYIALLDYADSLYIKSQKLFQQDNTHEAIKMLRVLVDFSDFTEDAKELMKSIECRHKFYAAIKEDDTTTAYNILAQNEDLQSTQEGKRLQKEYNDAVATANEFALDANIKEVNRVLEKYMKVSSKSSALADIYGWCYMVELEKAIEEEKEQVIIENGIKNYILYFGLQDQIESLFNIFKDNYPQTKLNLDLQTKGSKSMWRSSMIVNSILY